MKLNKMNNRKNDPKPKDFLPIDAVEFLKKSGGCENDYLSFHRFGNYAIKERKDKKVISVSPRLSFLNDKKNDEFSKLTLQSIHSRQQLIMNDLPDYLKFKYKVDGRLLLGVGGGTPYTTISPMKLHPLYGIPYIPASSLKGVVHHCWLHEHTAEMLDEQQRISVKNDLDLCFGKGSDEEQSASGKLIFLDAYPVGKYNIVNDVMTPHYKEYYNSKGMKAPLDNDSPNIISIPAIENTEFMIYIGLNFKKNELRAELRKQIIQTVISTIEDYGIGAKTAIGYGLGRATIM